MSILVLNTGSSSLKFSLFDDEDTLETTYEGEVDGGDPGASATEAIRTAEANLPPGESIKAIGHRIVHGGSRFEESILIDSDLESELARLTELAPLHNPPALEAIAASRREKPAIPQVAAFDTSFFAHLPRSAAIYPVPWAWHEDYGLRRYGFHGLSHAYCAGEAARLLGRGPSGLRIVVCHIGNGASAAAILGGAAVGTTMGFTPLAGLMMGTRAGEVDPGILIYLIKEKGLTIDQVDDALNHRSGLIGVSGVSSDYREVEAAAIGGNDRARLALEIYGTRVRSAIGGLAATLGGLDAVVFAGGIGEHSARFRASACEGLEFLGVTLDPALNEQGQPSSDIARPDSPVRVLVVHTREDLMIAREVRRLVPTA